MATLKLNSQTVITESSGTLTAPALDITTGTLGSNVTIPASLSSCVKLYHNAASDVASLSIDGYFDDSIYSYYELHLKNVRKATSSNNEEFFMRANTGGTSNSSLAYWTTANGNANDGGGIWESHRADNDGNGIAHMDNTWHMPHNGNTAGSAHYHLRIVEPQSTTRYKNVYWQHVSNRHNSSGTYRAILGHHMCNVETTTALTGFTFSAGSSGNFECTATLYGFKS